MKWLYEKAITYTDRTVYHMQ